MDKIKAIRTMPVSKLRMIRNELNLDDDESIIFDMTIKNRSIIEIAAKLCLSTRTISRKKLLINEKLENLKKEHLFD